MAALLLENLRVRSGWFNTSFCQESANHHSQSKNHSSQVFISLSLTLALGEIELKFREKRI